MNGTAGSLFEHTLRGENGYFSHIVTQMQYSAVAGACMMVKKDIFEKVNGFDEDYSYQLKVREEQPSDKQANESVCESDALE